MLNEKTFNNFIVEINRVYETFSVWVHVNNQCVKYQKEFNNVPKDEDSKYANFFNVVLTSLINSWVLGISRLLDTPYHKEDIKKEKPRLSIYYILEQLNDKGIKQEVRDKLSALKQFIYSNRDLRNERFAHRSLITKAIKQKAGIEDFFELLDNFVNEVKKKYQHLSVCNDIGMKRAEELSNKGVLELFNKIVN